MEISVPDIVNKSANNAYYKVKISSAHGEKELWFGVEKRFSGLVSASSDAALVALIIPAMLANEEINIHGTVSQRLLFNLSGPFQKILCQIMPWLNIVPINASRISSTAHEASGVITGFSGGIDSFCTLADFKYNPEISEKYKITHLLFNNIGSHGKRSAQKIFNQRYNSLVGTAQKIGLPFVKVDSNLAEFYGKGIGFKQTHTIRNAAVAFLLQEGIGTYYYSSGLSYEKTYIGQTKDAAYSDLVSLPMLTTERLNLVSVGGEYNRVEKTLKVAEIADSFDTLDVCAKGSSEINCSECKKCIRTMLTLELAGKLDRYISVFDFDAFKRKKSSYIASAQYGTDPLFDEIDSFALAMRKTRLSAPPHYRYLHWLKKEPGFKSQVQQLA